MIPIIEVLKLAVEKGASDVHLTVGSPPALRVNGELVKVNVDPLTSSNVKEMCYSVISDEQKADFEKKKSIDFSFYVKGLGRFRGALIFQKTFVYGSFRLLNQSIPSLQDLGLSEAIRNVVKFPHGLVLVTGPTGSGKTTTLSSLINEINTNFRKHIVTIEDPIESVYDHKKSIITQREVGVDCHTFFDGLRSAMRVDPDVCLVGEMRDKETVEAVLRLAETGHLMFSTLHTNSACKSLDRILGIFEGGKKEVIRNQLSTLLRAVISQRLLPSKRGGRKLATEIMFPNSAIRNLIREGKFFQIPNVMQTSSNTGMKTMNAALTELVVNGDITIKTAFSATTDKDELYKLLQRANIRVVA